MLKLEDIGLTQAELQDRVVQSIARQALTTVSIDDESEAWEHPSKLHNALQDLITKRVNEAVAASFDKHILPDAHKYVENVTLQATNKWGEKTGKAVTFREYLVERAENYLREEVDYEGKAKGDSYSWRAYGTRIAYMVHKHLNFEIERAMKEALQTANNAIAGGIADAVRLNLENLVKGIKATVKVER